MEPKHVITQVVGIAAAVVLVRWGWNEFRTDWRDKRRLPLVTGPYMGGRTVLLALGCVAVMIPAFMAIGKFRLLPTENLAFWFIMMLAWASAAFVFGMMGASTRQARRHAKGWITVLGDGAIRVDANDASAMLKLGPGVATLRPINDGSGMPYVQLDLDDGQTRAHVWGMVGIRALKLLTNEAVPRPQGLMVATSMAPLCRELAPYLKKP
ncbi:MAG TPA: hypothetical protein VN903_01645 [Polyangia bacterium]|nr:hypothetical protein [Polyangia bacterium]